MRWMQFSHAVRRDPLAGGSAEALVVLLHDFGASAETMAARTRGWARATPTTAFVAVAGHERLGGPADDTDSEVRALANAERDLLPLLDHQMRSYRLAAHRAVLVGVGYGGTLALYLALHRGWNCAGVLAYGAKLVRPLPQVVAGHPKVRLVECLDDGHIGYASVRDLVMLLAGRGIDARGVLLAGPPLSDAAIRHGGAYLLELVATAQHRGRQNVEALHAD